MQQAVHATKALGLDQTHCRSQLRAAAADAASLATRQGAWRISRHGLHFVCWAAAAAIGLAAAVPYGARVRASCSTFILDNSALLHQYSLPSCRARAPARATSSHKGATPCYALDSACSLQTPRSRRQARDSHDTRVACFTLHAAMLNSRVGGCCTRRRA